MIVETLRNVVEDVKKSVAHKATHLFGHGGRLIGVDGVRVLAARMAVLERKLAATRAHFQLSGYASQQQRRKRAV